MFSWLFLSKILYRYPKKKNNEEISCGEEISYASNYQQWPAVLEHGMTRLMEPPASPYINLNPSH